MCSKNKVCLICEKNIEQYKRFGYTTECNHFFCLECIDDCYLRAYKKTKDPIHFNCPKCGKELEIKELEVE